jgi:hypothetical protein
MIAYSLGGGLLTASRSLATALRGRALALTGLLRHVPPAVIHLRACNQYS